MCADNGVVAEGISQSGQEITAAVTENLGKRNTSVCKMAQTVGAEIFPVDIGVNTDRIFPGVISRKVKKDTDYMLSKISCFYSKQIIYYLFYFTTHVQKAQ